MRRNKIIVSFLFCIVLVFGIVYANSYVQAQSKQGYTMKTEEFDEIYQNKEERMQNSFNNCEQNQNCPIYQQNGQCLPDYHCRINDRNHHRCNR